jgi:organic radical activating enzyme
MVQIETNGSLFQELPYHENLIVICSPKTGSINGRLVPYIGALKYVVTAGDISSSDGLPNHALGHPAEPRLARPPLGWEGIVYVQPADSKDEATNKANLDATINSVLNHGYTLGLQIHKLISME